MSQSCLKKRCMKASCVQPERTTWTAPWLSHEIWNLEPANLGAQILTATTSTNSSHALMCKKNSSMSLGKANEVHSLKRVAPPRCKEGSQVNSTSSKSRRQNTIMAEPLKFGKRVNNQSMSDSISLVTGKHDGLEGKLCKRFKRRDINIWPGRTQAVTNDSFPSNDCN